MSVGNWRKHILVDCAKCDKPMGFYVMTTKATCKECKAKELSK